MDVVTSVANEVVRETASALQVAVNELAKQANSVAQLANTKDPLSWLTGEDPAAGEADVADEAAPPALLPVPLAGLQPWGSGSGGRSGGPGGAAACHPATPSWSSSNNGFTCADAESSPRIQHSPPFAVDHELNCKVIVWEGDVCSLDVDALVAPAAAGYLAGASTVFGRLLRYGGRDFRADLKHLDACRSGEARLTKAYGLPCQWLLLTVGPKYKEKYHVAAQNTLHACYRESFQLLEEAELRTVAIPCTWYHQGYPVEEHSHVALRTVRRALEKLRHIESVVFVAAKPQEAELYASLLPLYFPRTPAEAEAGMEVLPDSCWSTWGEVAIEERRIRLSSHLFSSAREADESDEEGGHQVPLFSAAEDDDRSFLDARSDADDAAKRRMEVTMNEAETPELARQACLRYLRRAREVRPEPEASRFTYRVSGQDRFGRRAVVLLGARIPSLGVRDERTLPLFVKELELLRGERFVLLYANSGVSAFDTSNLEVLQEMLAVVGARYRGALDQFFVLHPGLCFRAAFALGRAVSSLAASVWQDTVYCEALADLEATFALEQLGLPEYVRACDQGPK